MRRAVFLDRDGVINEEVGEHIAHPEGLRLLPGALNAITALYRAEWTIVVFTNQSGVGRGTMSLAELNSVHDALRHQVEVSGGHLEAIYACPHHPGDACECRKPKPGMLFEAAHSHGLDLKRSYAVGDSPRDIAAGHAAGCTTVLSLSGHTALYLPSHFPEPQPDRVVADLATFAEWLIATHQ